MKYYSEKTQKLYNSEEELTKAENALVKVEAEEKAKKEARGKRAKEVVEAYENYEKLLKDFLKDYGNFHMTINEPESLFDFFFNRWPF